MLLAGGAMHIGRAVGEAVDSNYDELARNLALAVSRSAQASAEFRKIVQECVLAQFDGDYDLLLSQAAALPMNPVEGVATRSSEGFTMGDLLEHYFPEEERYTRSGGSSIIEQLQESYPDLQVSVPIHAEEWDPDTYTPVVCFIPSDYEDLKTPSVQGFDAQGNSVTVDALNEPDEPVIVVGRNERSEEINPGICGIPVGGGGFQPVRLAAPVVTGVYQNNSVKLTWTFDKTQGFDSDGFNIYRSGPDNTADFTKIANVANNGNFSYTDYNTLPNKQYVYKVESYTFFKTSSSEPFFITTNYDKPNPVSNLGVKAIGKERIQVSWTNPTGTYCNTRIERIRGDNTTTYQTVATLDMYEDIYLDTDVDPGVKYTYRVRKEDGQGRLSDSAQDYAYATYRNPDAASRIYLKQISCDLQAVEGWLRGKPEFKLRIAGMDASLTPKQLSGGCDARFASRTGNQTFTNVPIYNWSYFNNSYYYPALTFSLEEFDTEKAIDIPVTVAVAVKASEKVEINFSTTINIHFENRGEYCGESSIVYFENPEQWLYFPNNGAAILISEKP